jgi:protein O-mannosyl-transferase
MRPVILAALSARPKSTPLPRPEAPGVPRPWTRTDWLGCLVLALVTVVAYQRVWHAGFIWDDDAHVTRPGLQSLHGLWRIWFEPGATQQYYPVLYSAFWAEHRLWADSAACYHGANVLLHACAACLLFRVLRRLSVPGALLGAALFAVHPVCAESVAWISEQKNTLSAVFYLLAALAYIAYDRDRRPGDYAAGVGLFILALLSKSVAATLPAALLVILWWKRGRLSLRGDWVPLAPWLVLGAGAGSFTAWMERTHVGANGAVYAFGIGDRVLVAGRSLWFYLGKLVWPVDLTFVYPRWTVDARDPVQYLFPAGALAALAALWVIRNRSRGPLAAALLFAGTLFPALGFINLFPFIYSFVADHFQYMAAAMALSAAAAGLAVAARRLPPVGLTAARVAAACAVAGLAALTWRQTATYASMETLWRATIARNPSAWMAYNNLAADLLERGRVDEAIQEVRLALAAGPANAEAYVTLADALLQKGLTREALEQYQRALEIEPTNAIAHNNLGNALLQAGRPDEAVTHYRSALETKPDFSKAHANLGDAYLRTGRLDEAISEYGRALEIDPTDARAHANLGTALAQKGRAGEAIAHFQRALDLNPRFAIAETNLGNVLLQGGRTEEALGHYRKALEHDPQSSAAHNNLGYALLKTGRLDEAIAHFRTALALDPANAGAQRNLADALTRK